MRLFGAHNPWYRNVVDLAPAMHKVACTCKYSADQAELGTRKMWNLEVIIYFILFRATEVYGLNISHL